MLHLFALVLAILQSAAVVDDRLSIPSTVAVNPVPSAQVKKLVELSTEFIHFFAVIQVLIARTKLVHGKAVLWAVRDAVKKVVAVVIGRGCVVRQRRLQQAASRAETRFVAMIYKIEMLLHFSN